MRRNCWNLSLVLVLCWVLPSCATRDSGYKISKETIAFIQPGSTTRAELIENLGPPLFELKNPAVVAYSWGKARATGVNPAARQEAAQSRQMEYSVGPVPTEEGGLVESRRWICCVALDDKERVTRVERIELEGAGSLEEAVRKWASGSKQGKQ